MEKFIDSIKKACGCDDVFLLETGRNGVHVSINDTEWLFIIDGTLGYRVMSAERDTFVNYSRLPGIVPTGWLNELERVSNSVSEVLEFISDSRIENNPSALLVNEWIDSGEAYNMVYSFFIEDMESITCSTLLAYHMESSQFNWHVRCNWAGKYISGADNFLKYFKQELILKPLGKSRMEDVTEEDREVLRMIHYG